MSLFTDYVVKLERRALRERAGTLPLVEVSRKYERQFYKQVVWLIVGLILSLFSMYYIAWGYAREHYGSNYNFVLEWLLFSMVPGGFVIYRFYEKFEELTVEAVRDRIKQRDLKDAKKAAEDARKAAEAAEQSRQRALVVAEQGKRQQALFDFRVNALAQMETGIKELLYDRRERAEWIPESADEEHLYEMIRKRFQQAGQDVPELGLLRRSTDPLVIMILGDRSFLPKEPTDEVLSRRQLPPVVKLLS